MAECRFVQEVGVAKEVIKFCNKNALKKVSLCHLERIRRGIVLKLIHYGNEVDQNLCSMIMCDRKFCVSMFGRALMATKL